MTEFFLCLSQKMQLSYQHHHSRVVQDARFHTQPGELIRHAANNSPPLNLGNSKRI